MVFGGEKLKKKGPYNGAANHQLRANEEQLQETNHRLGKRIKELNCLYALSQLAEQGDIALEDIFQELAELIPLGWQYPEITSARITFEGRQFKTSNFRKTDWMQSADIKVNGQKSGIIEVCYLEKMPAIDEGPFLKEERILLKALAERMGHIISRKRVEKAFNVANQQLLASVKQAELMAKEALQASKAKSEFLTNMSHEIRTPMNVIIGFSDILRADSNLSEKQKGHIDIICDNGQKLLKTIDGILEFSKIEAGEVKAEIDNCRLGQLISDVESLMNLMASKKDLQFEVVESDELPAEIRTDRIKVLQCLTNLANNAIKFTEKGFIRLTVSLYEADDTSFIRFDVEDSGIGIPSDKIDNIFDHFYQADGSATREHDGVGLGLTITRRLAQIIGGELFATSQEGKGSKFSLLIPVEPNVIEEHLAQKMST